MKKQLDSDIITLFCAICNQAKKDYSIAYDEVNKQDKLTQDLLHKLELDDGDKNKIATQLKISRKDRRYYKDIVEKSELIKKWVEDNQKSFNHLQQLLGEIRKVENYHSTRTYKPRVMKK